jgi:hypothetical protein
MTGTRKRRVITILLGIAIATLAVAAALRFLPDKDRPVAAPKPLSAARSTVSDKRHAPDDLYSAQLPDGWFADEKQDRTDVEQDHPKVTLSDSTMREFIIVHFHPSTQPAEDAFQALSWSVLTSSLLTPVPFAMPGSPSTGPFNDRMSFQISEHKAWQMFGKKTFMAPELGNIISQERIVVVPMKRGYFEIDYTCYLPGDCEGKAFDSFLASIRLGKKYE